MIRWKVTLFSLASRGPAAADCRVPREVLVAACTVGSWVVVMTLHQGGGLGGPWCKERIVGVEVFPDG